MKDRLAEQAQRMLERGVRFENICLGERRPTALIRKYANLYAQGMTRLKCLVSINFNEFVTNWMTARVDTLEALDSLQALSDFDELKSKLLFSVVVVRNEKYL